MIQQECPADLGPAPSLKGFKHKNPLFDLQKEKNCLIDLNERSFPLNYVRRLDVQAKIIVMKWKLKHYPCAFNPYAQGQTAFHI